jgi:hypothetical protein
MTTQFFDSARWGLIPHGERAMLYRDGRFAAPPRAARNFTAVRWITVLMNGADCGAIDFEIGNAAYLPGNLRHFVTARQKARQRSRVYCDLSNVAYALNVLKGRPMTGVVFWLGTLNNDAVDRELTAKDLCDILAGHPYNVKVEPAQIWGHQWKGGPAAMYDESVLLGTW